MPVSPQVDQQAAIVHAQYACVWTKVGPNVVAVPQARAGIHIASLAPSCRSGDGAFVLVSIASILSDLRCMAYWSVQVVHFFDFAVEGVPVPRVATDRAFSKIKIAETESKEGFEDTTDTSK